MIEKITDPLFLLVDLFCGFGGTTTGFLDAESNGNKIVKVIACVNHDPKAIKSHWLNHQDVKHFEEDIRTLDLTELIKITRYWQSVYPKAYLVLWASLECTNFSKAKGGQARDADSRTLAEHLFRYQVALNPDYIKIENVVEFMSWGPMIAKATKTEEGYLCCQFSIIEDIERIYDENDNIVSEINTGNLTVVVSLYPESRKNGQDYMKWRNKMCSNIYHDDWKEMNSADFGAFTSRNRLFGCFAKHGLPIVWPETTHAKKPTTIGMFGIQKKWKAVKEVLNFEDEGLSIFNRKKPLSDKTFERIYAGLLKYIAKGDKSFISKYYSGKPADKNKSVEIPVDTITCIDHHSLIQPQFLASYYGNGHNLTSIESPAPTLPTKDRVALIQPEYFIDKHFGAAQNQSIDQPAGSIMPNDKHRLVECTSFIANPSHGGHTTSIESPCPVIIARQDKAPLYLIDCEAGNLSIAVYDYDTEVVIRIKQFMSAYGLVDIKMRMLRVLELLKIQGFPEGYKMVGNQTDQKKFIGNSVHPLVPKAWAEAFANKFIELLKAA